jgi:chemotaxis protein CheX
MLIHDGIKDLLNSTIESVNKVIPLPTEIQPPKVLKQSITQREIGVLVGITGDLSGRIVIEGDCQTFSKLGEYMFGMPFEGEMLHSFVGEIANMIAGNTATIISQQGCQIDITPPTVMVGHLQLYGFEQGVSVPVDILNVGEMNIIFLLQNKGAISNISVLRGEECNK